MLSKVLIPVMAFLRVTWVALSSRILFFPGVPLCLLPKQQSTLLEFIFGLCLHDCLLSVRQDYLGELCWPFSWVIFSSRGSFSTGVFICTWATLLFLVLGWCLIWKKDVSFPNLQAAHLDFYPSWLYSELSLYDCSFTSS